MEFELPVGVNNEYMIGQWTFEKVISSWYCRWFAVTVKST